VKRLAFALVVTLLPAVAQAQSADELEQAKTYFNAGATAFAASQFEVAVQAFEQSYKLAPRPAILFSIAQAERRQYYLDRRPDVLQRAIRHYRQYLEADPKGNRRGDAAQALAELEPAAARADAQPVAPAPPSEAIPTRLMVSSQTRGADVWVDGRKASEVPVIEEVTPGKHRIRVAAAGYFDDDREVVAVKGSLVALDIPLRERPGLVSFWVPDGAQIAIDGRPQGTAPLAPIEVAPGRHLVAVTLTGHRPHSEEIDVQRGETRTLRTGLSPTGQRIASKWVLGGSVFSLATGALAAGLAVHEQNEAQKVLTARTQGNISAASADDYASHRDLRDRYRLGAAGWFGAAVVLGTVGTLLYAFDQPAVSAVTTERPKPKPAPSDAPDVSGFVAPGTMGISVSGRFLDPNRGQATGDRQRRAAAAVASPSAIPTLVATSVAGAISAETGSRPRRRARRTECASQRPDAGPDPVSAESARATRSRRRCG
jgi:hypothetical protein